jgi:acyl carrier protein
MAKTREDYADAKYEAPHPGLETQTAEIVAEILEVDRFGRADSFYDFGGTSLQAIRICARIEKTLGIKVEPLSLLDNDTLADFVADLGIAEEAADG